MFPCNCWPHGLFGTNIELEMFQRTSTTSIFSRHGTFSTVLFISTSLIFVSTSKYFQSLWHQELKIFNFNLKYNSVLNSIQVYLNGCLIIQNLMLFDHVFKIVLNVWYRIRFIRQFKLFIPYCSWYFKFIVSVRIFYIVPCVVHTEIW